MHTGAGSGNSDIALSWAEKEDNTSCPFCTGLVNAQIPVFRRKTLPASHFTERTFFFSKVASKSGSRWHEGICVSAWITPVESATIL